MCDYDKHTPLELVHLKAQFRDQPALLNLS